MQGGQIRWGILGCGDVTEVKSGPALQKAERSSVVAVMRRDAAKAADYAARHGVGRWYADADALIADPEVDAVYVATPPSSHEALTAKALAAGKPVLVEKPMAMSVAECDRMIDAANAGGRSLTVAFYRRALPRFEKLRQLIAEGAIGKPRIAAITHLAPRETRPDVAWKVDPATGGGGMFFDMHGHTLDWLQSAFGPAGRVAGMTARQAGDYPAEDFVGFTGLFGAVAVTGLCAYTVAESREDVTIHGEAGSLTMSFFRHSPILLKSASRVESFDIPDPPHVHQPLVERVVAHLLDGAPNPCSGEEARQTNQVLADIYGGGAGPYPTVARNGLAG
jgi:predicted dehydrogenase